MNPIALSLIAFAIILGGAFVGSLLRRTLPGNHLADDGRKQGGSVLPANQVKTLESLVDEIERVSGVGERPFGIGRK